MPRKEKTFHGQIVIFEVDAVSGKVMVTDGSKKEEAKKCEIDMSTYDPADPNGTIIASKHNPTCYWYFVNGQWYYYCC